MPFPKKIETKLRVIALAILILFVHSCAPENQSKPEVTDNVQFVNVFIGTGGHGHTFPGATTPNGMVQLSPDTRTMGWDACGGYHYSDSSILGFSHTHLSGTGIGDYGDILFMPFTGETNTNPGTPENPDEGYRSRFSHENEFAEPGYYQVFLTDYGINAELSASPRSGFHRYTFENADEASLLIDLSHTIHGHQNPVTELRVINNYEIEGYKRSRGWGKNHHVYFHAKFNQPFEVELYENNKIKYGNWVIATGQTKAVLKFKSTNEKQVLSKVGISSVDYEGARNNLDSEISHWNFDKVREDAYKLWQKELSKVEVNSGGQENKTIFFSALYHCAIAPNIFTDVDGRYRGIDQRIHQSVDSPVYTIFSLWDTFRAFHPLLTIIDPEINNSFVNTILNHYDLAGSLPKWELAGNYTGTMIGYHAVPVIVDAFMKGISDFDVDKAYEAIKKASRYDTSDILVPDGQTRRKLVPIAKKLNEQYGFIPSDLEGRSVSKALEYAYNDWCIAQMAKELGKSEEYSYYLDRSKRYSEYFDSESGFMRGKLQSGEWREPFDPRHYSHKHDDYTEGNAFQWTWFVPHDVPGLIELMGGESHFISNLDTLFHTSSDLVGKEVSGDISGMIGQYAHGNEPSHHIAYMYNYVGQPWKTQKLADSILSSLYFNDPNGLSGNEDCGQMSAWYVLSALGFYSFSPGEPAYTIGRPLFDEVTINLSNGNSFKIIANGNSKKNMYVQSVALNETKLSSAFIKHEEITRGGSLVFEMGPEPNKELFK